MTYRDFIKRFAREYGYRKQDVKDFMTNLSIFVKDNLILGDSVHIRGFLDFELINQQGHSYYDFKNKRPYISGDRYVPNVRYSDLYNQAVRAELDKGINNVNGEQTITETNE